MLFELYASLTIRIMVANRPRPAALKRSQLICLAANGAVPEKHSEEPRSLACLCPTPVGGQPIRNESSQLPKRPQKIPDNRMTHISTSSQRQALMRRIRTKDTTPEMKVRRALHERGFRFRLHRKDLPGTPDIVLPRFGTCIFVHGCFWHGHENCTKGKLPKTRSEFWAKKISQNQSRDRDTRLALEGRGWKVGIVWECCTKTKSRLQAAIDELTQELLR